MTHESKHLIELLEARVERNLANAQEYRLKQEWHKASVAQAWADASSLCLDEVRRVLPWVEEDARYAQAMGR